MSQELFGLCGADKTEDAEWPKLVEMHLPHNGLTELDDSLVRCLIFTVEIKFVDKDSVKQLDS